MNAVVEAWFREQIKTKRATLVTLRKQADELKHLQSAVATMPRIQAELAALERVLAIEKGEVAPEPTSTSDSKNVRRETPQPVGLKENSIPSFVYRALKEAGKPMTGDQIMPVFLAAGRQVDKTTVVGAIYRYIKKGQWFRKVAPGTFGLMEWKEQR